MTDGWSSTTEERAYNGCCCSLMLHTRVFYPTAGASVEQGQKPPATTGSHRNQSTNQSVNQPINQSIGQSTNQSTNQSINIESINPSINQSINQLINQSVNQPINQSINQSTNQSINQPINRQSTDQSIDRSTNQPTNQSIIESINRSINQSTNQPIGLVGAVSVTCFGLFPPWKSRRQRCSIYIYTVQQYSSMHYTQLLFEAIIPPNVVGVLFLSYTKEM